MNIFDLKALHLPAFHLSRPMAAAGEDGGHAAVFDALVEAGAEDPVRMKRAEKQLLSWEGEILKSHTFVNL